jgi:hypothetical protein
MNYRNGRLRMDSRRSAFSEAGRRRPFAVFYWALFTLTVIIVVATLIWGSSDQRIISGYLSVTSLVVLSIGRHMVARTIERERDAGSAWSNRSTMATHR